MHNKIFYRNISELKRIINKISRAVGISRTNRDRLCSKFKFTFLPGSTGPFGEQLDHKWLDYSTAKEALIFHRNCYMKLKNAYNFGFWCDWHAKLQINPHEESRAQAKFNPTNACYSYFFVFLLRDTAIFVY
jgi:hypothetical protein